MTKTIQQKRLRALGYDPADLPTLARCSSCNGSESGDISYELFSGYWSVWCGCGIGTDSYPDLIEAINDWNRIQLALVRPGHTGGH